MLRDAIFRIRLLFRRNAAEGELEHELRFHLEREIAKNISRGMSEEEATLRARLAFGGPEQVKEECRDARGIAWFENLFQDLQYASRMFRRAPGFTGLIVLMLALGIGANVATFSVMDAILLRMLPVREPGSLFRTVGASGNAYDFGGGGSYKIFQQMQERTRSVADLMAYEAAEQRSISINESDSERLMQQTVSGNYFEVLGVQPVAGRLISSAGDQASGQHAVAVIGYALWERKFDKSPNAIGSKLRFGDHIFNIIGVAPRKFFGVEVGKIVDVWTPIAMAPLENLRNDHMFWLRIMGRLHPGVTIAQAAAPMQAVMNEVMLEDVHQHAPPGTPKEVIDRFLAGMRIKGVPAGGGISYLRRQYRQPLEIMIAVVGLVLIIACTNVANLLIAKGSARRQEIAIRFSLGAGRRRVLQQLVTEGVLLAVLSAGAGLSIAHWAAPILVRLLTPSADPAQLATALDMRLLGFTGILALLTVVICGLFPAIRLAGIDMYSALKSGRGLAEGGKTRAKQVLAASQIALSLVLVIGAVLFTRTLVNLVSSYLGFNPASVLVARISFRSPRDEKTLFPAWSELLRRVRGLPGIEAASLSSAGLFAGDPPLGGIRTTAAKAPPSDPTAGVLFVSTGYFQTLNIPFAGGRDFDERDNGPDSSACAVVNEAFARKFFGSESPIGRKLTKMANAPDWMEVVGIVKDVKFNSLRDPAPPMVYLPYSRMAEWFPPQSHPGLSMSLQVRGHQGLSSLSVDLGREAGPQFIVSGIARQQQLIDDTLVRERLLASVASLFGALSLLLAALGLYGIMSYAVVQRRQEIGVRMALGAAPKTIMSLMLRDSAAVVTAGILVGTLLAFFATGLAKAFLYGLAPTDPATFVGASVVLLAVSLAAAVVPAYRAAGTDPMVALRNE